MWLAWRYALVLAVGFVVAARLLATRRPALAAIFNESAIIAVLYSLWQIAGRLSLLSIERAVARGEWLWDLERRIGIPNELAWQEAMLPSSFLTQTANLYYAIAHVPSMGMWLLWQFTRHNDGYRSWRNTLALLTGACLLVQLLPVAPPRLTAATGMIDTGLAYGQSVYGTLGLGIAGQLQAMPSIHVAWAAVIGWAVWSESPSRWRWVGPAHFIATSIVVAVTGNHYHLDGIVAIILLIPCRWLGQRRLELPSLRG